MRKSCDNDTKMKLEHELNKWLPIVKMNMAFRWHISYGITLIEFYFGDKISTIHYLSMMMLSPSKGALTWKNLASCGTLVSLFRSNIFCRAGSTQAQTNITDRSVGSGSGFLDVGKQISNQREDFYSLFRITLIIRNWIQ